ncbi:LysR family transcriptional regulator [Chelatococcus sp. CO-6]|nr:MULTISPECIES: LysR family transcriptional regulator [unclassified Chelatococcus]ALA19526.1 LysR family transcriptional regulator [Chelatococcus sp. CO-6]
MRFDLTDLRLFLAVLDAGSITHGAAEAGLSLAAASERLRDMEEAGKVALLERGRRGVTATAAGEALAHHARIILRQMAQMRGDLGEHASGLRATVQVAANTAALSEFLPQRLGPWMAANPRIDVALKERQSAEVARAVTSGLAEIGILSDAVDTSGLVLRPFAVDRLVVVAPHGHPLTASKRIAFAEILHEQVVGLAGGALQEHIDAQAARMGARLKMRVRMPSFDGICHMVAAGAGLGVVPEVAARRCGRSMKLMRLRLTDAWTTRRLAVCVHHEEELTPPARALFAFLASDGCAPASPGN